MVVKGIGRIGNIRLILLIVLFGALSSNTSVVAQRSRKVEKSRAQEQGDTIKINSSLVAVPVSVTDAAGRPVRNLTVGDFRLEEEGKAQQVVTLGAPGKSQVEIALLFDISGSISDLFPFQQKAASRFLGEVLKPNDAVSIFTIGVTPRLVRSRVVGVKKAVAATRAIEPTKEATAFFDTVVEAAQYLSETAESGSRRVIVVISDGEDMASKHNRIGDALKELQRSDCLFYSINPSGSSIRLNKISLRGQNEMVSLASATGGEAFLLESQEELDKVFDQIKAELHAQYLLGYYSTNERPDGGFRRISVRVPTRPGLRLRARQGYYAN